MHFEKLFDGPSFAKWNFTHVTFKNGFAIPSFYSEIGLHSNSLMCVALDNGMKGPMNNHNINQLSYPEPLRSGKGVRDLLRRTAGLTQMRHKIEHTSSKRFHANENIQLPRRRTRTQHRCGRGEYAVRPVKRARAQVSIAQWATFASFFTISRPLHASTSRRVRWEYSGMNG